VAGGFGAHWGWGMRREFFEFSSKKCKKFYASLLRKTALVARKRGRLSLPPVAEYMLNARESENLAAALLPLYLPPFNAS